MANDVRYIYVREGYENDDLPTGPITIAYRFNDEKGVVEFNTATCGKKDNFSRKVGRAVASGRLSANKSSHPNRSVPYGKVSGTDERTNTIGPKYNIIAGVLTDMVLDDVYAY